MTRVTVSIPTRNRLESLVTCVRSLERIASIVAEVIVVDDASSPPVEQPLRQALGAFGLPLTVLRNEVNVGATVARNVIAARARGSYILNLDDDAYVLDDTSIPSALEVLDRDPRVAVVALAQTDAAGVPRPDQPAPSKEPCVVPCFTGYGYVIRTRAMLEVGGYRENFVVFNEEKELCKRLLDRGLVVVYLPQARVAHVFDPRGRDLARVLRYTVRNGCLDALYNEPLLRLVASVPARLASYFVMRRSYGAHDPWGLAWILRELIRELPRTWRGRRALRWATYRKWNELRRSQPAYVKL